MPKLLLHSNGEPVELEDEDGRPVLRGDYFTRRGTLAELLSLTRSANDLRRLDLDFVIPADFTPAARWPFNRELRGAMTRSRRIDRPTKRTWKLRVQIDHRHDL